MNKALYTKITDECLSGKAPSIQEATKQFGTTPGKLKKFMKRYEEQEDDDGNNEKNPYMELYRTIQARCAKNTAELLIDGKINEQQALKYFQENDFDASYLPRFKEIVMKQKATYKSLQENGIIP